MVYNYVKGIVLFVAIYGSFAHRLAIREQNEMEHTKKFEINRETTFIHVMSIEMLELNAKIERKSLTPDERGQN